MAMIGRREGQTPPEGSRGSGGERYLQSYVEGFKKNGSELAWLGCRSGNRFINQKSQISKILWDVIELDSG
jgi:hypothetical protein